MIAGVKALVFDVFGTVVDWRTSIIEECAKLGNSKGIGADWGLFTDGWRARYRPFMDKVRRRELPWTNLDALHRMALEELLVEYDINGLSESDKTELILAWHRLQPWPDSVLGLTRLKQHFIIATLSNGNVALLTNMAKSAGLPWDCILSAELAKAYKPDREVYEMATRLLGLRPEQVMMVAAHQGDLRAAQQVGLRTAFVMRPFEHGSDNVLDLTPDPSFDLVISGLGQLASEMIAQIQRTGR
jgi:2-haloacid dehalogenase